MNIISSTLFSLFFLNFLNPSFGQKNENDFVEYLYNAERFELLKTYKQHVETLDSLDYDSNLLNFYVGKAYYHQQKHDSSNSYFEQVVAGGKVGESKFLIGINAIFLQDYTLAKNTLTSTTFTADELSNLKNFELAGISLLERDYGAFSAYDHQITTDYYFFEEGRKSLQQIKTDLMNYKEKSPFLAGLYSAVLPGAGKFYAGKKGQGIYSLVISSLLAFQAIESYQKAGFNSARFIIYGGLFSLFHVGNVWSSALSVKKYNEEFYEAVDYRIKLDLHLPIRSIFN